MCRCNKDNPNAYCEDCQTIIPKKGIEKGNPFKDIRTMFLEDTPQDVCFSVLRKKGYFITEGEIEIAYGLLETLVEENLYVEEGLH